MSEYIGLGLPDKDFSNIGEKIQRGVNLVKEKGEGDIKAVLGFIFTEKGKIALAGSFPTRMISSLIMGCINLAIYEGMVTRDEVRLFLDIENTH